MSLPAIHPDGHPPLIDRHVLGMAEMGFTGLSEQWLLRRAGDLHWRLIARAMGQKDAVFTCAAGQPLYAAFCATSLKLTRPELAQLGCELTLAVDLYRIGHGRLASQHRITVNGQDIGRLVLISTFVGRADLDSNRSIVRRAPKVLAMPPEAPDALQRFAHRAGAVARSAAQAPFDPAVGPETATILPCPSLDFNAAGLLYFPSFTALAERALFRSGAGHRRLVQSRHVVYLGNVEPGEHVTASLIVKSPGEDVVLRGQDGRPLALLRSRYADGNTGS